MFRRILVPIDYSEHSRHAVEHALELAKLTGAQVKAVHVWVPPELGADIPLEGSDGPKTLKEMVIADAERHMASFLDELDVPGDIEFEHGLEEGSRPAESIRQLAEAGPFDLIVLGTHGRSGFRHLILGSVAERVVRNSRVPVLTVPLQSVRSV